MKRLKIMKSYIVLWLFIYFLIYSNIEHILVFFMATLTFNLAVLTVLTIGVIMVMKAAINLVMLAGTFGTLAYKKGDLTFYLQDIDKIMPANIAHMFYARAEKGMLLFTTEESRAVIEWIEEKFSNQNRYTNYFTGTVLMIGLLGTFSGLLIAIDDMGRIILSLSGDIDLAKVISDFSGPLGGMAVGFGSSLFGVVAAIILGVMGYILNKNQEMLVEGVEDWLKGRIIDSGGDVSVNSTGEGSGLAEGKASFMDVFIDNLSMLSTEMGKISKTNERLTSITIASVQQARDEHELSVELFEDISKSLKNIDQNAHSTIKVLGQQFNSLQISMNTNHAQLIAQQQDALHTMIEKLENALELTQTKITQKFQTLSDISSKEIKDRVTEISSLITAIDNQLSSHQKILSDMKNSGEQNQEKNENLLSQLIDLFKESSSKLDLEQETLNNIYTHLGSSEQNSKEYFEGISELINSLSSTLQKELNTLDSLQNIQKTQSELISESLNKSTQIHDTLVLSQEQNLKQEEHFHNITSKIDAKLTPLSEIEKSSNEQKNTLIDLLEANKQDSTSQQENLSKISLQIQDVKDEFLSLGEKQTETSSKSMQDLSSKIESLNELNTQNQKDNLEALESKIDTVGDSVSNAIVKNVASSNANNNKKSGGFFGKMFS